MTAIRPMRPRDTAEEHRTSTPLELFFDLCFVAAVAQAAGHLHHTLTAGHPGQALAGYGLVFFAIWWAWMNFTWFASAYDTDDVAYRLAVLVEIAGVLVLAAGVPRAFDNHDFAVATFGYTVMRSALVGQWLRAAGADPDCRRTARRYAAGVALCEAGWLSLLALPERWRLLGWVILVPAELAVPVWAERAGATAWHPRHIAERYGLFTLIVLGESVLAATTAVQSALDAGRALPELVSIAGGGLLIVFAMWWMYFDQPAEHLLDRARLAFTGAPRSAFAWGYGHLAVFASAAAVGAGLETAVEHAIGQSRLSASGSAAAVTVPVAGYLLSVWALHARHKRPGPLRTFAVPVTAALVLASTGLPAPVPVTGLLVAGLVGTAVAATARRPR